MKLIIGLMLIAAVSCAQKPARKRDVNEILDQGAGWSKSASGYAYDIPETIPALDEPAPEAPVEDVPQEVYVEELVPEVIPEEAPVEVAKVGSAAPAPAEDVPELDYLPPASPSNEYLPPARRRLRFRRRYRLVRRQ